MNRDFSRNLNSNQRRELLLAVLHGIKETTDDKGWFTIKVSGKKYKARQLG